MRLGASRMSRWLLAPTLAAAMIAAAVVIPEAASAAGKPSLRPLSAQALVKKAIDAKVSYLAGTLSYTANIGLPNLSQLANQLGGSSGVLAWLSGTHTARVWYGGATRLRVAVPVGSGEDDLIVNANTAYVWQSGPYSVTKVVLPTPRTGSMGPASTMPAIPTPASIASHVLAAIGPTTAVKVTATAYVAGRPVYDLVLSPRDAQSLVGQVVIAVDSTTGLPLRVQVFARGARSPALSFGFTRISFARPAASNFTFTPPQGAKVTTVSPGSSLGAFGPFGALGAPGQLSSTSRPGTITQVCVTKVGQAVLNQATGSTCPATGSATVAKGTLVQGTSAAPRAGAQLPLWPASSLRPGTSFPTLVGSGWGSVLVVPAADLQGPATSTKHGPRSPTSALQAILGAGQPVSGTWGTGHLIRSALVDILAVSHGPVLVGAVTPQALEAAASHLG